MKIPVDIHAHQLPQIPGTAIVNRYPDTFVPEAGEWYSVGMHPWHIPTAATPAVRHEMDILASLAGHPQVLAVGEAGLDKLADTPQAVQIEVFEYQARLSMELGKPLVIHLVKAMDELLKLKRQIKPANPWIIHGFRGKAALAEEYLRHGFTSLSEKSIRKKPCGLLLPAACSWKLTRVTCRLRMCIAGQPKSVAYLWLSLRRHCRKISPKSFLNNKSCLLG